jgi:hypothetical protein
MLSDPSVNLWGWVPNSYIHRLSAACKTGPKQGTDLQVIGGEAVADNLERPRTA